jgi:HrpA-like RNA helicase
MLRAPLEKLVLQVKSMDLPEDCSQLLRRCPDPPTRAAVRAAEMSLQNIQALAPDDSASLAITPLGRHLASLPCDPRIGRLLLYGVLLGCAYSTSAVAACLSARSPFLSPSDPEGRSKVDNAKASLAAAAGAKSDHMAMAQAVQLFSKAASNGDRKK